MDDTDALHQFAAHQHVRGLSERTIERRQWFLRHWIAHLAEHHLTLATATAGDVERFMARWPSPSSRYAARSDLHQLYQWGTRRDLLEKDPTGTIDPPRLRHRGATPIPPEDIRRLIESADGPVRTMIMLGAYAGLRCSEIAAVQAEHIRLDDRALVVRDGKGAKDCVLPLAPALHLELAVHAPSTGRLFPGITGQGVGYRIRKQLRHVGIRARPHDLRHSFGTECARMADGNLLVVQQLMRHTSVTTTQRYVGWVPNGSAVVASLFAA